MQARQAHHLRATNKRLAAFSKTRAGSGCTQQVPERSQGGVPTLSATSWFPRPKCRLVLYVHLGLKLDCRNRQATDESRSHAYNTMAAVFGRKRLFEHSGGAGRGVHHRGPSRRRGWCVSDCKTRPPLLPTWMRRVSLPDSPGKSAGRWSRPWRPNSNAPSRKIKATPVTLASSIEMLQDGRIDMQCGSTTHTLDRAQKVDFPPVFCRRRGRVLPQGRPALHQPVTVWPCGVVANSTAASARANGLQPSPVHLLTPWYRWPVMTRACSGRGKRRRSTPSWPMASSCPPIRKSPGAPPWRPSGALCPGAAQG